MKHSHPSKRIEFKFIYHSHKELDKVVFDLMSDGNDFNIEPLDLARNKITSSLLLELSQKLPDWQTQILDEHYMDHSIRNPRKEFEQSSSESKLNFLRNNVWTIGTPIVVLNEKAMRLITIEDARSWVEQIKSAGLLKVEIMEY